MNPDALRRAVERSTRASAALEGRSLPADHVRSARVALFLATRGLSEPPGICLR